MTKRILPEEIPDQPNLKDVIVVVKDEDNSRFYRPES